MVVITHREKRRSYLTQEDFETAEKNGIGYNTAHARVYRYGWDAEDAITKPVFKKTPSEKAPWARWKDKSLVCRETFSWRLRVGWDEKEAALTKALTREEVSERSRKYNREKALKNGTK